MQIERLGPYRIVRELGRGGMGTVFEGVNVDTGEPAAVKLLVARMGGEEGFRDRFEAEIEALRKLNHPNIVRLFGFGEQDGHLYYAMELVDGPSLEEEYGRGRRFDWREVAQIGIELCHALRHAHDRGVVHRDIKPGNLLLTRDGHVKLSDFGIARLFGNARQTAAGSILGTAEFMAPEQAEGLPTGPRADLYSLGVVFYVLLTRRPLFQAKSLPELLHKQRCEQPEPIARYARDVPVMLQEIIAQLLEKDPARRFPNTMVLARQLEAMQRALSAQPDASGEEAGSAGGAARPLEPLPSTNATPAARTLCSASPATEVSTDFPRPDPLPNSLPPTAPGVSSESAKPAKLVDPAARTDAAQPPMAPDGLPETKETRAFVGLVGDDAGAAAGDGGSSRGRFVSVAEEDLDSADQGQPHAPWISWQTWGLAVGLIAVGLSVWYFLQDPTPDALYDKIAAAAVDGSTDSLLRAEDEIREFLLLFPDDPRCHRLREYENQLDLYYLERKFELRAKGLAGTESLAPVERDYLEAISYVRLDPERAMARLQALVDLYGQGEPGNGQVAGPTGKCLMLARRRLEQLHKQLDQQMAERAALLQDRLDQADRIATSDPGRARTMYEAVLVLYNDKSWAERAVEHAREALAELETSSPDKTSP